MGMALLLSLESPWAPEISSGSQGTQGLRALQKCHPLIPHTALGAFVSYTEVQLKDIVGSSSILPKAPC